MHRKLFYIIVIMLFFVSIPELFCAQGEQIFIEINNEKGILEKEKIYIYDDLKNRFLDSKYLVLEDIASADYEIILRIAYRNNYLINVDLINLKERRKTEKINTIINKSNMVALIKSSEWAELFYEITDHIRKSQIRDLDKMLKFLNKEKDTLTDSIKKYEKELINKKDSILYILKAKDSICSQFKIIRELKNNLEDSIHSLRTTSFVSDSLSQKYKDSLIVRDTCFMAYID